MGELIQQPNFQVFLSGMLPGSVEDWGRALRAPSSELAGLLTESDKEFAHKLGIAEEDYARTRLLHSYGEARMKERGKTLGEGVGEILGVLGSDYRLNAVVYESAKPRWVVRIQTPQKIVNVAIDDELAGDIIDSNTVQDQERLKQLLLSSVGRNDLLPSRGRE